MPRVERETPSGLGTFATLETQQSLVPALAVSVSGIRRETRTARGPRGVQRIGGSGSRAGRYRRVVARCSSSSPTSIGGETVATGTAPLSA